MLGGVSDGRCLTIVECLWRWASHKMNEVVEVISLEVDDFNAFRCDKALEGVSISSAVGASGLDFVHDLLNYDEGVWEGLQHAGR